MAKMKAMSMPLMKMAGSYHPPKTKGAMGQMNIPRRGRVGKQQPSFKKFGKKK